MLVLGEIRVHQNVIGGFGSSVGDGLSGLRTGVWQDYGEVSLMKPTGLGQKMDTVSACKPWGSAV